MHQHLNVRRYTARAATVISLRESDVGRPLKDLTTILKYPKPEEDAKETLNTRGLRKTDCHHGRLLVLHSNHAPPAAAITWWMVP